MNLRELLKPFLLYSVGAGALTVGGIGVLTRSGLGMLILAALGLLLIVLGGGVAGPMSPAGAEHAEDMGLSAMMVEDMGLSPTEFASTPPRLIMILYGIGLLGWSLVALFGFQQFLV